MEITEGKKMVKALIAGFIFGAILQWVRIDNFDKIAKFITLKDFTVLKFLLTAVGSGMIFLSLLIHFGYVGFHIKPFLVTGIFVGGILFGIGMAMLGYCPGTAAIAIGNGSLDALFGLIGGLLGGLAFTYIYPYIKTFLGPDLGKVQISYGEPNLDTAVAIGTGLAMVILAWLIHIKRKED
jgi:uncharacterized membrane protein YedE/YeeE